MIEWWTDASMVSVSWASGLGPCYLKEKLYVIVGVWLGLVRFLYQSLNDRLSKYINGSVSVISIGRPLQ